MHLLTPEPNLANLLGNQTYKNKNTNGKNMKLIFVILIDHNKIVVKIQLSLSPADTLAIIERIIHNIDFI